MIANHTYAKHDPSLLPCSRLRFTIWQMTSEERFGSAKYAADITLVRTSMVESAVGLLIKGRSTRVLIARLPSSDQTWSYSRRASSCVGCVDHSMLRYRR